MKKSYYDISRKKNLEISRENTEAWKRKFCSRNDLVPLCTYLFFWLPICDQHLNQSTFLLILFCSIILHAWKIWKYIITSITIIQQRKNLFSSSRNLAGPFFFPLTTGFWGRAAWRPPSKWNTRVFLHFPKELSYGYIRFEGNGKIPLGR